MIALLIGTIALRNDPYLIINVHGVGYKVLATSEVLAKAVLGQEITVHTYTHVREDMLDLYGFSKPADLWLFELLISVSGVGPKTAVGVFSQGTGSEIVNAIATSNVDFFTAVPRLGKKNAQKLIIELKSKVGSTEDLDLSGDGEKNNEIIEALKAFGFTSKEAGEAIRSLSGTGTTEEKIKMALKYLGK